MRKIIQLTIGLILCVFIPGNVFAQEAQVRVAIDQELEKRKIQSGTLDIYDGDVDAVRNLRMFKNYDAVNEKDGKYLALIDCRDTNTGDIVKVEVEVVSQVGNFVVEQFRIAEVAKLNSGSVEEKKEYSDEEIQTFMKEYIKKQTEFNDGKLMLFDKDVEKMRNLELIELKPEVRRMGIFTSSSSQFKDADSGEILDIDIAVEIKKGKLNLQALRIRDVRK